MAEGGLCGLVVEAGLFSNGLVRGVDLVARNSCSGDSSGQGSAVVSPNLALGDPSRVYSCCWAPTKTADLLSRPRLHILFPSSLIHRLVDWTVATTSPLGARLSPSSIASATPGGEKWFVFAVSRRCHRAASLGQTGRSGGLLTGGVNVPWSERRTGPRSP